MKDLQGNEIIIEKLKLETTQDVKDCGKAIKIGMEFAIGIMNEAIAHFHKLAVSLVAVGKTCERSLYKK